MSEKGYQIDNGFFGNGDIFEKRNEEKPEGYQIDNHFFDVTFEEKEQQENQKERRGVIHIVLDNNPVPNEQHPLYTNYVDTQNAIDRGEEVIWTTITHFCSFRYNKHVICWVKSQPHEITIGACEGTEREIREAHNLENLVISGVFDWF